MKKFITIVTLIIMMLTLQSCKNSTSINLYNKQINSGDVKFYKNGLLLTSDGNLMMIDTKKDSTIKYDELAANWIDVLPEENLVVHASANKKVFITSLDDDQKIISSESILEEDILRIDPTIFKIEDTYFITLTKIIGNVNNADKTVKNGTYTVELYSSKDLHNWTKINDVLTKEENIEDIDILVKDEKIVLLYEQELVDKGASSLNVISSIDRGINWSEPITLINRKADNEPAKLIVKDDDFVLLYSSDQSDIGSSYYGAKTYASLYDNNFLLKKHFTLDTTTEKNILLYDVEVVGDKYNLLYVNDYAKTPIIKIDSTEIIFD